MIIATEITIAINQYENVKPVVDVDTEDLEGAKKLIIQLWDAFHDLCLYRPTKKDEVGELNGNIQMDEESRKEYAKTDVKMQGYYDRIRKGEAIPFSEWDSLTESEQKFLHQAQLMLAQENRLNKKDAKLQV